jgi:hypothetical protein
VNVCVGIQTSSKPYWVTLKIATNRRVVVTPVVVVLPGLRIEVLPRESEVVGD